MPHPTFERLSVLGALGASAVLGACHDWDDYDPRLGASASGGGNGGAGACSLPLTDTFDAPTIGLQWGRQENAGGKVAVTAQELVLTLPTTMAYAGASLLSVASYEFTGCRGFVKLTQVPDPTTKALALLALESDRDNSLVFLETEGKLQVKERVGREETILTPPFTYDPVEHAYLGIREQDGIVIWETSPDGKTWTPEWRATNRLPSARVQIKLGAYTYQVEQSVPGEARFDNVNVAP